MPVSTFLLIFLSFVLALIVALFQYFYKTKRRGSKNAIFATLRFLAIFALLVLLINPKISSTRYYTQKPALVLAVDNSSSIEEFGAGEEVINFAEAIRQDQQLKENFDIKIFSFGKDLEQHDSLNFEAPQTNLPAVFNRLASLYEDQVAPTVLITDGNQTIGEEFTFAAERYRQPVLPVVVGDTVKYQDLNISRINVNKYAFLNNRFPVEIMLNYSGNSSVETKLEILEGNSVVHSEQLSFSSQNNSEVIRVELPAGAVGVHNYLVRLEKLDTEKNLLNNTREFAVEVIDERTKVLIAYSVLHPDLGALQNAIEANQQREVELQSINQVTDTKSYQLVILYQPDSRFKSLMDGLQEQNQNYFLITGPKTDWNFLNRQQDIFKQELTNQSEEFFPVWNENFKAFQTEDIGFSDFPPLEGSFGDFKAPENLDVLLGREVQGVNTGTPLMGVTTAGDSKVAFLFGADIWRWRSVVFRETGSFEEFDDLIGKLVQFLASKGRQDRLLVQYEPLYSGTEEVIIAADYFDQSYIFDRRARLEIQVENSETGEQRQIPLLLNGSSYKVDLSSLPAGDYNFRVSAAGEGLSQSGSFRILDFDVEKQFGRANIEGLQQIADQRGGQVYFLQEFQQLKNDLLSNDSYATVQKSREKNVSLIDWKYLLGIIVLALGAEWFLRKYYGLI
ncbi:VWA domain-containing protein [Salinimicrobium sp. MT39]|uniref:VWA domain-containing protein n=1 Tax=Salinimicrobium profundisediminis TaxID=2994553 RepID=A0A9X3CUZ1_9FLAO|nr:VWA domain-containing protein [Salinimicrobium profundisediminis]MCX2837332.1 VWA domain-containing protein [Salinimicrobium profundisediminis]